MVPSVLETNGLTLLPRTREQTLAEIEAMPPADKAQVSGWDEARVRRVLNHYESQSDEESVAEDEASFETTTDTTMTIPTALGPAVRELIEKHRRTA